MSEQSFTKEIYAQLVAAVDRLPKAAVEKTKRADTRKGYDTTGYQYQYLVNVLNEVVGPAGWSLDYALVHDEAGNYKSGQPFHDITVETTVTVLGAVRKCVGGHVSGSYTDALKGAITNSFKKTVAFFGVGKSAYEGTLDDDYRPYPDEQANRVASPAAAMSKSGYVPAKRPEFGRKCVKCGSAANVRKVQYRGKSYDVCPACDPTAKDLPTVNVEDMDFSPATPESMP